MPLPLHTNVGTSFSERLNVGVTSTPASFLYLERIVLRDLESFVGGVKGVGRNGGNGLGLGFGLRGEEGCGWVWLGGETGYGQAAGRVWLGSEEGCRVVEREEG